MKTIEKTVELEADIVIIGGGGAGLPAALTAIENGAKNVILLEKRNKVGGNAVLANGIFACESPVQRLNMIDAPKDELFKKAIEWHRSSYKVDQRIIRAYINKSGDTIHWLVNKGVEFEVGVQFRLHYHQNPCWHVVKGNTHLGRFAPVMKLIEKECQEKGVKIFYETIAKELFRGSDGRVNGILIKKGDGEYRINTKSIIIATGGFMGNKELFDKYFPFFSQKSSGGIVVPHMGDGLQLAADAGATLDDYAALVREIGFPLAKDIRVGSFARQPVSVWVNKKGERFMDEAATENSQPASNAVIRQQDGVGYVLCDEKIIQDYMENGWILPHAPINPKPEDLKEALIKEAVSELSVKISKNWDDIAQWIGANPDTLNNTVREYNSFCDHGYDEAFAKERRFLVPLNTPPFYAIKFGTLTIETIGPVRINHHMEVLDGQDDPIPGLFAAGVVTSGWMSDDYCGNYLFGSALGYSINSGRIAGESAFKYASAIEEK